MSLPGRPSPWKSRRADSAGRARLAVLLGAAGVLAAAGGFLGLHAGRAAAPGMILSVAKGDGSNRMGMGIPERTYVAGTVPDGTAIKNLTEDFYSASSPSVSYDGRRFLFAGRQTPSERPAIWERGLNGSHLRTVTEGNGNPAGPVYLADGRIAYSDLPARVAETGARSLFSCAPDGTDVRRLTFGNQQDLRPRALPDGRVVFQRRLLVPDRPDSLLKMVIHPDGTGLALLPPSTGREEPPAELSRFKAPKGDYIMAATETEPRAVPPVLTSVIRAEWKTGTLLCLNVYNSRIPAVAALPPGSIRRVRVTTKNAAGDLLAGEAPVMSDGSFFVEVPADTPLQIHLLGEGETVLASFESGIWVRANENHGCIGCHEAPEMAPENRQPLAVQRQPSSLLLALTRKGGSGGR